MSRASQSAYTGRVKNGANCLVVRNGSGYDPLSCFIVTGSIMNWQKFLVGTLFFIMAVGGTGGLMLVGYTIILHSR
ncbi:hypothetical protein GCM10007905_26570 [Mixta theicola]|nr:hypothetical protein GCM10007905_26570 [Mixta theicola]